MIPPTNQRTRTLLVDDHPVFLDGLTSILKDCDEIEILNTVTSAEEALQYLENESLGLVITDINLPGMNGIELIKKIKEINPNLPVLVLSMFLGRELVKEILSVETEGYLSKKINKVELFDAVKKIIHGGTYYSNEITSVMMDLISKKKSDRTLLKHELTHREREILQLICQEYSSKEIASKLFISVTTVDSHRRSMFKKTGAKSVIRLIRYAVENNLVMW
ncbi:response regulator transcription factor [Zobellia galactanivorans]|uniref:response regulator transcription factor n=1 Tax=Zobellia galactanivorans (strain DSM 12802 / CCUG 47099 / CIP 106680 / NCIMB 13871 / Dsij) TaxID=63186 RepID=UPI001C07C27F|nr:response regulator transcription factor [Zobellia galactanivorans]MBU3027916.1 response regulator transcription factor [Zobellia galactanivorans]